MYLLSLILLISIGHTFAQECPVNEKYTSCGSACPVTCATRNQGTVCIEVCVPGCFCKSGYLRNDKGKCVLAKNCPPLTGDDQCTDPNEAYNTCGTSCPITCNNYNNPPQSCTQVCVAGCFCNSPYVRNESTGKCVLTTSCPIIV